MSHRRSGSARIDLGTRVRFRREVTTFPDYHIVVGSTGVVDRINNNGTVRVRLSVPLYSASATFLHYSGDLTHIDAPRNALEVIR